MSCAGMFPMWSLVVAYILGSLIGGGVVLFVCIREVSRRLKDLQP